MSYFFVILRARQVVSAVLLLGLTATHAAAITTSEGTVWNHVPDAWTRGNNADTSYFGWDRMETAGKPFHGMLRVLDDATPELGVGITATGTRLYQGANGIANPAPTLNGHLSGSQNYYTFNDLSNDTITGTAPASGVGGYTTVVLQILATPLGGALTDMTFAIDNSVNTWTLQKDLFNLHANGLGQYWMEWSTNAANPTFKINMTSAEPHRAIDAFQVDTYWTAGNAPAVNSISVIPEPAAGLLAVLGLIGTVASLRRRAGN